MTRRPVHRVLLALAVSLSLAACGGGGDEDSGPPQGEAVEAPAAEESPLEEPATQTCQSRPPTAEPAAGISTDLSVAPDVPPSDVPPPCDLLISDVVVGTGPEAVAGSTAAVRYVGAFYESGEEFDSSWSRGPDETLPVVVGAGQVIPGFEQAISGMNVGGRRLVTIPSDLGYGPQGQGPIPGGATLTFVIDLVDVTA
ncbi:FKBP-type peptidyl-prolyl cis-trans isomerase [Geodermatophilus sp. DF01-2]|uniref:FKBP-type peptidyl-prolyl cis-trans isomerase n=1 Tax=Geodermatophilus sp. DF01-2 TaxID=2559610 RepID=UPI001073F553|nr:FKBP-type peptidyl-prolyl cis-trans isomerase [Geodermatophilus sp. DF01_2]TFV57013.1 FKBP-type peptidyl-prolyl cis-trans isomerase [Geodermatophilus sp. DF01_2]